MYMKVIESQKLLRWPEGLSFGSDGIYVTGTQCITQLTCFTNTKVQILTPEVLQHLLCTNTDV